VRYGLIAVGVLVCALSSASAAAPPTPTSAQPLVAPAPTVEQFIAGGDEFAAPTPPGFCDPAGRMTAWVAATAKAMAGADEQIGAVWLNCDAQPGINGTVKLAVLGVSLFPSKVTEPRSEALKNFADLLRKNGGELTTEEAQMAFKDAQAASRKVLGPGINMDVKPHFAGVDDYAVYGAGHVRVAGAPEPIRGVFVVATTVIKGRPVAYSIICFGASEAQAGVMLEEVKLEARRLVEANPDPK